MRNQIKNIPYNNYHGIDLLTNIGITLERDEDNLVYHNIKMEFKNREKNTRAEALLQHIQNLQIDSISSGFLMITGLEFFSIRDRGWEGLNWEIHDYEKGIISFYCRDIEILRSFNSTIE